MIDFTRAPVQSGRQTLSLVSAVRPAFGGIDPDNTRITRNSGTVLAAVE